MIADSVVHLVHLSKSSYPTRVRGIIVKHNARTKQKFYEPTCIGKLSRQLIGILPVDFAHSRLHNIGVQGWRFGRPCT